jgi:hypothetical protein
VTFRDIPGWTDYYRVIDFLVDHVPQHAHVVELGPLLGRSTVYIAQRMADTGRAGSITAVDLWPDSLREQPHLQDLAAANPDLRRTISSELDRDTRWIFQRNVDACLGPDHPILVQTIRMDSVLASADQLDDHFDLVWIDDCHDHPHVRDEILAWIPKVAPTGWIGGHDLDNPGVLRSLDEALGPVMPMAYRPERDDHPELVHAAWNRASWFMPASAARSRNRFHPPIAAEDGNPGEHQR